MTVLSSAPLPSAAEPCSTKKQDLSSSRLKSLCLTTGFSPGQWWSPHPWRGSKTVWMWHLGTWFSRHGGVGLAVGLDDLRGVFQP